MTRPHFTEDFKIDAIKQITERGYSVADVSTRFGESTHSLYAWMKRFSKPPIFVEETVEQAAEIKHSHKVLWIWKSGSNEHFGSKEALPVFKGPDDFVIYSEV